MKQLLADNGINCQTDTDTEVLVQFISYLYNVKKQDFFNAVRIALDEVIGTFGILVMCQDNPGKLIAARNGSPLVIGIGDDANYIASDLYNDKKFSRPF